MKNRNAKFKLSILSVAVASAVMSMYAYADEEEAAALKYPTSSVEVEEIYVSQGSQKFGEYNGLNKQGGYINGNINIRGGNGYKKNEEGDTTRWSVQGTNLGLTDRSASVGYSDQGNWDAKVGFDQLQHNLAPGYQTPYTGQMGGNGFQLPANLLNQVNTATAFNPNGTRNLTPAQTADFGNMAISTTRENTSFSGNKIIDKNLSLSVDFNHLNQSGAKLQGMASAAGAVGATGVTGEAVSILPMPTNFQTDTVNVALNWMGEKGRLTGSYFGSFFRDAYSGVTFNTFAGTSATAAPTGNTSTTQTMSTAPSNQLQQLNLAGGYDFTNKTKLTGSLSYGRNTQNSSSAYDPFLAINAAAPFNGLVNTAHADVKVVDQSIKDLKLSAGMKYDSRINLSQSNMYYFQTISNNTTSSTSSSKYFMPNTPLSIKNSVFDLGGDYRLTQNQKVALNYAYVNTIRSCNQYATGSGNQNTTSTPFNGGTIIGSNYPAGADCVTANYSRSNKINALYKAKLSETVDLKLSYGIDARQTSWNQNAIAAISGNNPNNSSPFNMTMVPGQNGGDYVGFRPYFEASRNQQAVKGSVNWQATDDLSFVVGGKYTDDQYPNSTYGVQNGNAWTVNFDTNFNYAENATVVAYAVQQNGMRNLKNLYNTSAVYSNPAYGTWNNSLTETDTTLGVGIRHAGLMSGKLGLTGDFTYSLASTNYNTTIPGAKSGYNCAQPDTGTCGSPGTISNRMASLKLGGSYQIDKSSKVGIRYIYQHLASNDYYYNGLQAPYTPARLMPTNQNSGSYSVNVIAASYTYSFD